MQNSLEFWSLNTLNNVVTIDFSFFVLKLILVFICYGITLWLLKEHPVIDLILISTLPIVLLLVLIY